MRSLHRLKTSTLDWQLHFKHDGLKFLIKRHKEKNLVPRTDIISIIFRPSHILCSWDLHTWFPHPSPCWYPADWLPIRVLGGLWCLSSEKELDLLVAVCLYAMCGQRVRAWPWCSVGMEEGYQHPRGGPPLIGHSLSVTSHHTRILTPCNPKQRLTKDSHISEET